jgi:hypothetical protein
MLGKARRHVGIGLRSAFLVASLLLMSGAIFGQDFTDASGDVTVRLYTGPWVFGQHNSTTVSVDSDFVLVGGGAEVSGMGNPGALLTGSYPDLNLTTWHAESKDHETPYAHYLRAYAIGLRLNGVSSVQLRSYMVLVTQSSTRAQHPNAVAALPPGYLLIGGGARANWTGPGLLLTESYPSSFQWVASAKDHQITEFGSVDAFAIGITSGSIPGFGSLSATYNSASTFISTGYGTASALVPTGWVLSSMGGQAQYQGQGRMLTQLIPYSDPPANSRPGGRVTSKDHSFADAGSTSAYVVAIQKQ